MLWLHILNNDFCFLLLPFLQLPITLIIYLKKSITESFARDTLCHCLFWFFLDLWLFLFMFLSLLCLCLSKNKLTRIYSLLKTISVSGCLYFVADVSVCSSYFSNCISIFLISLANTKNLYHSFHYDYTHEQIIVGSCCFIYRYKIDIRWGWRHNKCMENKDGISRCEETK